MKHPWSPQHFAHEALDARCKPEVIEAALDAALAIKRANEDLPVIFTLEHLGHLIDVNPETLRSFVDRRDDPYRIFRVKKRPRPGWGAAPPRASRTICVPSPALMHTQRWIAQNILNAVVPHPASFAFAPGRSLLDAASRHARCSWLIKLDLRNFFEAISERRVYRVFRELGYGALISFELARICTRSPQLQALSGAALSHRACRIPPGGKDFYRKELRAVRCSQTSRFAGWMTACGRWLMERGGSTPATRTTSRSQRIRHRHGNRPPPLRAKPNTRYGISV